MDRKIESYYATLRRLTKDIAITDKAGKSLELLAGFKKAISLITGCAECSGKLLFIGNGASSSISSHMAVDFWKNGSIPAMAFNDAALLTCVSNDLGYSKVFEEPIAMFANPKDILVAISSSGKSENIINAVRMARSKGCGIITLSGFSQDNPLRALGEINFYIPFSSYGIVEVIHHSICHSILDTIISCREGKEKSK